MPVTDALIGKRTARADTLLLRKFIYADTAHAIQFLPGSRRSHIEMLPHPPFTLGGKVCGRVNTEILQLFTDPAPDAPYILNRKECQRLLPFLIGIHQAATMIAFVFLGKLTRHLSQCASGCYAQGDGDARGLTHLPYQLLAIGFQVAAFLHV